MTESQAMAAETVTHAAEAAQHGGVDLIAVVVLLAAAVVAVPLFRRAGLGSVLGYLAAGLAIGPFGLGFFHDAQSISRCVASLELGSAASTQVCGEA